jgi:hypothetical protein
MVDVNLGVFLGEVTSLYCMEAVMRLCDNPESHIKSLNHQSYYTQTSLNISYHTTSSKISYMVTHTQTQNPSLRPYNYPKTVSDHSIGFGIWEVVCFRN